jgi:hypothetical protein
MTGDKESRRMLLSAAEGHDNIAQRAQTAAAALSTTH